MFLFLKHFKNKLFVLFLVGLILRIIVIPIYFNSDVVAQGEWASWLQGNGTKGFYEKTVGFIERPNYPPLINLWYFLCLTVLETRTVAVFAILIPVTIPCIIRLCLSIVPPY